jgi:hypothetical protein
MSSLSLQSCPGHGSPEPTHAPPTHVSVAVQKNPSLQGSVLFVFSQTPALQTSVVQTLPSLQSELSKHSTQASVLSLHNNPGQEFPDPTHEPPEQTSVSVQNKPSLHGSELEAYWQAPPTHVSVVQTLPSLQSASTRQSTQAFMSSSQS